MKWKIKIKLTRFFNVSLLSVTIKEAVERLRGSENDKRLRWKSQEKVDMVGMSVK